MKITWLGHSGFRIEIGGKVLLIDPWLSGNPMFEGQDRAAAIDGATHVLVSHGHFDHTTDVVEIAREKKIPVVGIYDLVSFLESSESVEGIAFNKGGTVDLGGVAVTMVDAAHSSSMAGPNGPIYAGAAAGYMIASEGHTIYFSGDTDVKADMALYAELHAPDIGILCAGGHFTMDMKRAGFAARKFFDFKTVIPCHYRTFPILEQNADALVAALPGVNVIEPEVMTAIDI